MIIPQHFRHLMWHTFAATRGGEKRIQMVDLLRERPYNAHQLCKELGVDYRTVLHHIKVLLDNQFITCDEKRYGEMYFLTEVFESQMGEFDDIVKRLGNKNK